jgi:hypothetical membrane protein
MPTETERAWRAMSPLKAMVTRVNARTKSFANRHPWIGPAVFMLSALYFLAQIVVGWVWNPPYSAVHNVISDLGNTKCGLYGGAYVCSTRHVVMNIAFILLGVVMAVGSLLIYQEFTERTPPERRAAFIGFVCLAVAGLGTALVGFFPENTVHFMHVGGAAVAIGLGNVGIFILGWVLPLPEGLRRSMLFMSVISITAMVLFGTHRYFGLGAGSMERIAAYPETVWLIRFGLYISRNHFSTRTASAPS